MNKNLLYLIPLTIIGGFVSYVTYKQSKQEKIKAVELFSVETDNVIAESEKALQELSDSIDDFGEQIRKGSEELNIRINNKKKEQSETMKKLKEIISKQPDVAAMTFHELYVEPDTEAEEYVINTIMPKCSDSVSCRLGSLFGVSYNTYVLSDRDYKNLIDEISVLKGQD